MSGLRNLKRLANSLPAGFRDVGREQRQAGLVLSYDAGDEMWELEWCALDPGRNFTLRRRELEQLLAVAAAREQRQPRSRRTAPGWSTPAP